MKIPIVSTHRISITKDDIEKYLGYKIESFKFEPVYNNNEMIGLTILVQPKINVEFINFNFTIDKSGSTITNLN